MNGGGCAGRLPGNQQPEWVDGRAWRAGRLPGSLGPPRGAPGPAAGRALHLPLCLHKSLPNRLNHGALMTVPGPCVAALAVGNRRTIVCSPTASGRLMGKQGLGQCLPQAGCRAAG